MYVDLFSIKTGDEKRDGLVKGGVTCEVNLSRDGLVRSVTE